MGTSFKDMKKNGNKLKEKLVDAANKLTGKQNYTDDRIWKPTVDKAGNGWAVIRFLPSPDGEDVPFVRMYSHFFQGPGGYYVENSLTTNNMPDPCAEYNGKNWDSYNTKEKQDRKRKLSYYSNIYVVNDPGNPENNGKVFLFKYGAKIFEKIQEAMDPQMGDDEPINPFDMWKGANFKLKIGKVAGYPNYDTSVFAAPEPLLDDDTELERIWKSEYSLQEIVAPDKFKSYDELKTRLDRVVGAVGSATTDRAADLYEEESAPKFKEAAPSSLDAIDDGGYEEDEDSFLNDLKDELEDDDIPF